MDAQGVNKLPTVPTYVEEENLDVKDWVYKILDYWQFIFLSVIICVGVVFLFHRYSTPRFEVAGTILIKEDKKSINPELLQELQFFQGNSTKQNEIELLGSYSLLKRAIETLSFDIAYYGVGRIKQREIEPDKMPFRVSFVNEARPERNLAFSVEIQKNGGFVLFSEELGLPRQNYQFPAVIEFNGISFKVEERQMDLAEVDSYQFVLFNSWGLARAYRGRIRISDVNKEASILAISMQTELPSKGVQFINSLINIYIQRELEEKNETATRTVEFIDEQLASIQDSLLLIERRLQTFRTDNRVVDISQEGLAALQKLEDLENKRAEERFRIEYYNYIVAYLKEETRPHGIISPSTAGIDSPLLEALTQNLAELSSQLLQIEIGATDANPQVLSLKNQTQKVILSIIENVQNLKGSSEILVADLTSRIKESERLVNKLPLTERTLVNIQRRFSLSENLFIYLQEKKAEAGIAKASNVPNAKVVDPPMLRGQTFPTPLRNYAIGFSFGLILPIVLIVIKDFFSISIQSVHEITKSTKLPVLASIALSRYETELVMEKYPRSQVAESFRKMRASMKFLERKNHKVVMVTSFLSGEGKSFLTMNTAIMLAKMGQKVLLLGLDLRKPKIFDSFGISNDQGMSQLLIGDKKYEDVIQSTEIKGLDMIAAGPIPPNPNELLMGQEFDDAMRWFKEHYDHIVIDTPPVGLVSDPIEISRHADVALFIIRQDVTPRHAIDYINDIHNKGLINNIGIVLNGVDFKKPKWHSIYGYGYGYGNYYGGKKASGSGYYQD
ncbi:MAG: polysaccharide biosynthesis tyrosine autokinase [Imperialibacter sp.]|uniref:GumC family protein n=1 Tax=Imperialibacter sp. TaxID=2038411 RepID=UPI0032F098F8